MSKINFKREMQTHLTCVNIYNTHTVGYKQQYDDLNN